MIRDALQLIGTWAQESRGITSVDSDGLHGRRLLNVGGKLEEIVLDVPPRKHEVLRLEDLVGWCTESLDDVGIAETVTWCSFERVVTVLNDNELRDSIVVWKLLRHPKFIAAINLAEDARAMDHRALMSYIRTCFREEVGPDFLTRMQQIETKTGGTSESTAAHGRDSFGKSVAAEVIGAEDIPEEIELKLPVWVRFDHFETVRFGIQINPIEQKFTFAPVSGAIDEAINRAIAALTERVNEVCDGRVMAGTP